MHSTKNKSTAPCYVDNGNYSWTVFLTGLRIRKIKKKLGSGFLLNVLSNYIICVLVFSHMVKMTQSFLPFSRHFFHMKPLLNTCKIGKLISEAEDVLAGPRKHLGGATVLRRTGHLFRFSIYVDFFTVLKIVLVFCVHICLHPHLNFLKAEIRCYKFQ